MFPGTQSRVTILLLPRKFSLCQHYQTILDLITGELSTWVTAWLSDIGDVLSIISSVQIYSCTLYVNGVIFYLKYVWESLIAIEYLVPGENNPALFFVL